MSITSNKSLIGEHTFSLEGLEGLVGFVVAWSCPEGLSLTEGLRPARELLPVAIALGDGVEGLSSSITFPAICQHPKQYCRLLVTLLSDVIHWNIHFSKAWPTTSKL